MKQEKKVARLSPKTLYVFTSAKTMGKKVAASNETIATTISRTSTCC